MSVFFVDLLLLEFSSPSLLDFFLSLISTLFGFVLLFLPLILSGSKLPCWSIRKIIHTVGGTYIAFIVPLFETLMGVFLTIASFLFVFSLLIVFSRGKVLVQFRLLTCRKNEENYSVLINAILTLVVLLGILLMFFEYPMIFVVAALSIAWGDAAGEFFGRKVGFVRYKLFNQKTLSGSIAVFFFNCLVFLIAPIYCHYPLDLSWIWKIFLGAFICTIGEALSWKWLDNLYIPIIAALLMFWFISF